MSFFSNFFNLGNTVANGFASHKTDILNTKKALSGLGYFTGTFDSKSDSRLFDGLKDFQKNAGLKVDGIMKPGGPTELGINKALGEQGIGSSLFRNLGDNKTAHDKPETHRPWFEVSKLPEISAEASASNSRTLNGLLKSSTNETLPKYQAGALASSKDKDIAIGEYSNFCNRCTSEHQIGSRASRKTSWKGYRAAYAPCFSLI